MCILYICCNLQGCVLTSHTPCGKGSKLGSVVSPTKFHLSAQTLWYYFLSSFGNHFPVFIFSCVVFTAATLLPTYIYSLTLSHLVRYSFSHPLFFYNIFPLDHWIGIKKYHGNCNGNRNSTRTLP